MASYIKKGESIFIPFRNGQSISDSQCKPRMYKTMQAFVKSFPAYYLGTNGVELVEYAEVVRCKDCVKRGNDEECPMLSIMQYTEADDFCSFSEKVDGNG